MQRSIWLNKQTVLLVLLTVWVAPVSSHAQDQCGGIQGGTIQISGNIGKVANANAPTGWEYHTPIGGESNWSAVDWEDKDWAYGLCWWDGPATHEWSSTNGAIQNFGSATSGTTTAKASDTPVGSYGQNVEYVKHKMTDYNTYYDDPDLILDRAIRVVTPSSETQDSNATTCQAVMGLPYGCARVYVAELRSLSELYFQALDWDHCQVREVANSFENLVDGCDFDPKASINTGGVWSVSDNTWGPTLATGDFVSICHSADVFVAFYCVTHYNLTWEISSDNSTWVAFHKPLYTFTIAPPGGGTISTCVATRNSGEWPPF